jgi:cell division septum initiation protein DivIVA
MNDNSDLLPNLTHEDAFEVQMRGYSRRQVDEFIARCRSQIRDLEQRVARALHDDEELRRDLATARQQALGAKPAHEEVSERIAQILKLADDEARSQKSKAHEEIARQRNDAQSEAEKIRTEAREQAERMLTAAQEQAERAITSARAEAEKTVTAARNEAEKTLTSARTEAERTTTEARKKSESALASAKSQAKKALDEATARATAIHDGAERRLNLLSTRHGETIKRLTDILDGVSSLVAAENARMSLEDEVDQATAKTIAGAEPNGSPRPGPRTRPERARADQVPPAPRPRRRRGRTLRPPRPRQPRPHPHRPHPHRLRRSPLRPLPAPRSTAMTRAMVSGAGPVATT